MRLSLEQLGRADLLSRKEASLQQIQTALQLFENGDFVCAITLALAAESQIPTTEKPHLWAQLMQMVPEERENFNAVRNWLKHCNGPDEMAIYEFEAAISLARAATKFTAHYGQSSQRIEDFHDWWRKKYLSKPA